MATHSTRMTLRVNLDVEQGTWSPGLSLINDPKYNLDNLPLAEKYKILDSFCIFLARKMRDLVKYRIETQYSYLKWAPLTPGYLEFKKKAGLSENIWEATGKLLHSITAYRWFDSYVIGIDPVAKYPNGTSVLFVGKCIEFGTIHMPARPLFGPTVRFMRRHVRDYWEAFLIQQEMIDESKEF